MTKKRPGIDDYMMGIVEQVATRSTCLRRKIGAVITKDGMILATGYNGQARSLPHCEKCYREEHNVPSGERYELCRSIHAETNAIIQAAIHGVSIRSAKLYCNSTPCLMCARVIVNAQIEEIVVPFSSPWTNQTGEISLDPRATLKAAGVVISLWKPFDEVVYVFPKDETYLD